REVGVHLRVLDRGHTAVDVDVDVVVVNRVIENLGAALDQNARRGGVAAVDRHAAGGANLGERGAALDRNPRAACGHSDGHALHARPAAGTAGGDGHLALDGATAVERHARRVQ